MRGRGKKDKTRESRELTVAGGAVLNNEISRRHDCRGLMKSASGLRLN